MNKFFFLLALVLSTSAIAQTGIGVASEEFFRVDDEYLYKMGMDTLTHIPHGLVVGASAPDFKAKDQNGNEIHLEKLLKEKPVILVFYRGNWCGICNRYLKKIQDSIEVISERAHLLAISPESEYGIAKMEKKAKISFPLISDKGGRIMQSYDVIFRVNNVYNKRIEKSTGCSIAKNNDAKDAFLPVPATYVVDQSGAIIYYHFDPNYRHRSTIKSMLYHLDL